MKTKLIFILATVLMLSVLLSGCTITSGVFTGMSSNSSDTSLNASYISFNGSITKRLPLKADDEVHFAYQSDDGLNGAVKQNGKEMFSITDSSVFTVPSDGTYDFTVEGSGKEGAFSLSWSIE
jgi:hypothetical protein